MIVRKSIDDRGADDSAQTDSFTKMRSSPTKVNITNNVKNLDRSLILMKRKPDLSKFLKELMEKNGITSTKLSKACSIPSSTLSTYLSGKKASYSPEHLASLADYFGVSVDFLLFGESTTANSLNSLLTEEVFDGYIKVRLERVIPTIKKTNKE